MAKAKGIRLATIGRCIYCLDTEGLFTNEHILAANLGGEYTLGDASCKACQEEINKNIEQPFLRGCLLHIRYRRGIGSRGMKERPSTLTALAPLGEVSLKDHPPSRMSPHWERVELAYNQHPTLLMLPLLNPAEIFWPDITGSHFKNAKKGYWIHAEHFDKKPDDHIANDLIFNDIVFGRFLAKTAHCWAVATSGLEGFKPLLTDFIRGKRLDGLYYFIGEAPNRPIPDGNPFYMQTFFFAGEDVTHITVYIQLFADLNAPVYQVVVGEKC